MPRPAANAQGNGRHSPGPDAIDTCRGLDNGRGGVAKVFWKAPTVWKPTPRQRLTARALSSGRRPGKKSPRSVVLGGTGTFLL
jgi:hypothetical protein